MKKELLLTAITVSLCLQVFSQYPAFTSAAGLRGYTGTVNGTELFKISDSRGIREYRYDAADATTADDGVTTLVGTASPNVNKRYKLYFEEYVLANWWNLDPTGATDCSAEMQKAIDFAINTSANKKTALIKVLSGIYQVKYLNIWRPSGGGYNFVTCTIEGAAPTFDVTTGLSPTTTFKMLDSNAYTINVQFGRDCVIRNIAFWGPQPAPPTLAEVITWTDAQWTSGGRNNLQSPQAAIVTDAYHGSVTSGDRYPGQSANYIGTAGSGTSGLKIEYCAIYNYIADLVVSPNLYTQNGDNIRMEHCYFGLSRSVWASGQPQSRANSMVDCYSLGQVKYLINCRDYGAGNGAPPGMLHCNTAGMHKYIFDIFGNLAQLDFTDSHFELIWALGRSGIRPVNFNNCYIEFSTLGSIAFQPAAQFEGGLINFNGGVISWNDNEGKMGFMMNGVNGVLLNGTWMYGSIMLGITDTRMGSAKYNYVRPYYSGGVIDEGMTIGPGATISAWYGKPALPGTKFIFGETGNLTTEITGPKEEASSFEIATVSVNATTKQASFTSAYPWRYQVGDLLVADNAFDDPTDIFSSMRTMVGQVISTTGGTITVKNVSAAITNGSSVWVTIRRIPNYEAPTIGDVQSGSPTITNVKVCGNVIFLPGDRIKGTGIPEGALVTSSSLAAGTITISTNATANATATKLFDQDYIQYGKISGTSALTSGLVVRKGDIFYNDLSVTNTAYAWVVTGNGVVGGSPAPTFKEIPLQ